MQLTALRSACHFWVAPLWARRGGDSTPTCGPLCREPQSPRWWLTIAESPRSSQSHPAALNAFLRRFRPSRGGSIWPPDEGCGSATGLSPLGDIAGPIAGGSPDDGLTRRRLAGSSGLDGLITNDKFCWIRHGRLKLNWSQAQLRQAAEFSRASDSLQALDGAVPLETANEAAVDNQATSQGNPRRTNPLGPSLSNSPESGSPQPTGDRRNCASPPSADGPPGAPR